jgi:hypothetical protein
LITEYQVLVLNVGAGWALGGKRGVDAGHACPEEVLPGGHKHASWGDQLALGRHWCSARFLYRWWTAFLEAYFFSHFSDFAQHGSVLDFLLHELNVALFSFLHFFYYCILFPDVAVLFVNFFTRFSDFVHQGSLLDFLLHELNLTSCLFLHSFYYCILFLDVAVLFLDFFALFVILRSRGVFWISSFMN